MTIQETIKEGIKDAMKAKDSNRLNVLRGLSSAFVNELVAKGHTPQTPLSDEDALTVIKRAAKQRKDAIEQYQNAGRQELAENEQQELTIIEIFLPEQMSEEQVREAVARIKQEKNITDKSQMGVFMGAVMQELKGKADGAIVKKVVDESFL